MPGSIPPDHSAQRAILNLPGCWYLTLKGRRNIRLSEVCAAAGGSPGAEIPASLQPLAKLP